MQYVLVAVGGALGAIGRYQIGKFIQEHTTSNIPFGTFSVNILGAILLGYFSSIGLSGSNYALIGDGFFGAFTTFSSFMYEGFKLFEENDRLNMAVYITLSIVLGVFGYHVGTLFANV